MLNLKTIMVATTLLSSIASHVRAEVTLVFGTYTADKPTETVKKFKPFLDYLSNEMTKKMDEPVKVRMKIAKSYEEGIQQLVDGSVDFSRFGPASYVAAKAQNPDLHLIAMESHKGKKTFKGVIAVHSENKMETLSELKGHSFAFGDELSTIGRYLAQQQLLEAGISSDDFTDYEFLGRHDRVGAAVGAKQFEAGAMKESTFKKMAAKDVPIRALTTFDNVTKPLAKSGFLIGTDSDYDVIRVAIEQSKSFYSKTLCVDRYFDGHYISCSRLYIW